jgi:poly(A) polymerase
MVLFIESQELNPGVPDHPPAPLVIPRDLHFISRKMMSEEVLKVLYRLKSKRHLAYLCGGGVRDLLLGIRPKDFDVATDAHPGRLKKIFRNARLVGKRFRLAHMVFKDGKIVEVSTFRKKPDYQETLNESLLIKRDNTFGTPAHDALRRDFTINALFYNIADFSVIDYVGGMHDLQQRMVRAVGDPLIRFQEDPVRICRGIRFASHLGFSIEEKTWQAMVEHGPKLASCPPPRIQEELLRLLRGKSVAQGFRLLQKTHVLQSILPELDYIEGGRNQAIMFWSLLEALDELRETLQPYDDALLWSMVFLESLLRELSGLPVDQATFEKGHEYLKIPWVRLNIPNAVRNKSFYMLYNVRTILSARDEKELKGRRARIFARPDFDQTLKLLRLYVRASGIDQSLIDLWERYHSDWKNVVHPVSKRRRRRRRFTSKKIPPQNPITTKP